MIKSLKILPQHFEPVYQGVKTAEVRWNDRDYTVGDVLRLREFDGADYTGQEVNVEVTHVLHGGEYGIAEGFVVVSFLMLDATLN